MLMLDPFYTSSHVLYEYKLVIRPQAEGLERLTEVRRQLFDRQALKGHQQTHLHVQLLHFHQFAHQEPFLVERLTSTVNAAHTFRLQTQTAETKGNGVYYLQFSPNAGLAALQQALIAHGALFRAAGKQAYFSRCPRLYLAQQISAEQYQGFHRAVARRRILNSLRVDCLLLLRRLPGERAWQVASRLELLNLPKEAELKQGLLFS